jgi:hypothetical protein
LFRRPADGYRDEARARAVGREEFQRFAQDASAPAGLSPEQKALVQAEAVRLLLTLEAATPPHARESLDDEQDEDDGDD